MLEFILGYATAAFLKTNAEQITRLASAVAVDAERGLKVALQESKRTIARAKEDWEDILAEARAELEAESVRKDV